MDPELSNKITTFGLSPWSRTSSEYSMLVLSSLESGISDVCVCAKQVTVKKNKNGMSGFIKVCTLFLVAQSHLILCFLIIREMVEWP